MKNALVLAGGIGAVCLVQAWVGTVIAVYVAEGVKGRIKALVS